MQVMMWPLGRLVKAIMEEKQGRHRELMRIMGVSESAIYVSWYLTYGGILLILDIGAAPNLSC